jgi:Putative methyltransferase
MTDWVRWHDPYGDPASSLSRRLARVRSRVTDALDAAPAGPVRVLSMCAGQGRDLVPTVAVHPRRDDVRAVLVELDPENAAVAREAAHRAGLSGVEVVTGDAATTSAYAAAVPADLALVCGVFGNLADADVRRTVAELPALVRQGGTVIWTRHRGAPDLTPAIRQWFADEGFAEAGFDTEPGYAYAVGTHVLTGVARPFRPDVRMFRFDGDGAAAYC